MFQLSDPCTHLWCSHVNRTDICKTKKGPPMDGTECGNSRWCVNGYCEPMSKRRTSKDGLRHNPRPGGKVHFAISICKTCTAAVEL